MIRRWVVLVAGIFCTLISTAIAQVHIKERVEIAPKKINGRMSQEDNATGLPYLSVTKIPQPEDQATFITVLAPCSIQISGTAHIDGDADICAWFSLDGYTSVGTVNENAYCGQTICIDMAEGSCCTGFPIVNPTITQTPTSITGHVDAQWCCIYPRFVHVTWDFQVTAIPNGSISADSLSMSAYPNLIDACDMSPYTSPISAAIVNAAGIPIEYCGSIPVQFTIGNPIAGLSLN
jgi:hypothetical protein